MSNRPQTLHAQLVGLCAHLQRNIKGLHTHGSVDLHDELAALDTNELLGAWGYAVSRQLLPVRFTTARYGSAYRATCAEYALKPCRAIHVIPDNEEALSVLYHLVRTRPLTNGQLSLLRTGVVAMCCHVAGIDRHVDSQTFTPVLFGDLVATDMSVTDMKAYIRAQYAEFVAAGYADSGG